MYLVVIGVLAIVLTISEPPCHLIAGRAATLAAVAAVTLLPVLAGVLVTRAVLRALERYPETPSYGQGGFHRGMTLIQFLVAASQAGVMLCTDWLPLCNQAPVVGKWVLVPGILTLVPLLVSVILVWIVTYPADRAVRQIALEVYLYRGKPLRPVWPLGEYLQYNLRHQVLFVLVPMLLILLASDVVTRYEHTIRRFTGQVYAPDALVGLATIAVAIVAPEILRHIWITQRLPDGPLRDRLLVLCRQMRLRCRDLLVWRSGGMIVNAAVMGVIAPLRYVLITDAMLEQMADAKIEAVFGHEAGHVKHHHIQCFLLLALISGCLITIFSERTHGLARTNESEYQLLLAGLGAVLVLKWGIVFGWISRRFERQADVFGVRTLAMAGLPCALPCALHSPPPNPGSQGGDPLCATAAHVFSHALYEVALLNGMQPEARSWRHSSIASRSRFLLQLAEDPRRAKRFERVVWLVQVAILVCAVIASVWAAQELRIWTLLGQKVMGPVSRLLAP